MLSEPLGDDIEGFISEIDFIFKYRKSTNDFTIGRADGYISTLYKPVKGYEQWLEEIQKYKTIMCKCGALASLMSGSGSTVFALAATEQQARNIAAELTQKTAAQVFVTKTISRN